MKYFSLCFAAALALLLVACSGIPPEQMAQKVATHKVFGSHMVLQRGRPIVISGLADPGMYVKVEFAGKTVWAKTGVDGEWNAKFPEMKAGGPYTLIVSGRDITKTEHFNDILIGDVWMCSGQSNMQMPVDSGRAFWRVQNCGQEVSNANYPMIRLYQVSQRTSPTAPVSEIKGSGWMLCSPETVKNFSAAGYFFGRELYKDQKVPIGLINSSWGGTRIEPWISEKTFQSAGREKEVGMIHDARINDGKMKKSRAEQLAAVEKKFQAWKKSFDQFAPEKSAAAVHWKNADYDDSSWSKAQFPAGFDADKDGVAWFRTSFRIPESWAGKSLTLNLGALDDCDETFFNGVKVGSTGTDVPNYWSKKRVYQVPGNLVRAGKNVLAIRITDYFGDGGIMDTPKMLSVQCGKEKITLDKDWKYRLEFSVDHKKIGPRPAIVEEISAGSPQFPSTLFNAMISPWLKVPIRGAIWYQGCSNAGSMDYYPLHKLLIQDWRRAWNNPEMPFIVTQLSGFQAHRPKNRLADDFWVNLSASASAPYALTREIQAEMLNLPNVGLAVTMDIGDHSDIHPGNKQLVGYRLAKEAERISYGSKEISRGPMFKSMKVSGNKVRVVFSNVGKGLTTSDGRRPGAFAIAGADGNFVWAENTAIDGDSVIVSSAKVKNPKAVRYAWTQYRGDVNLQNKDGFPAVPFRSDKPAYR